MLQEGLIVQELGFSYQLSLPLLRGVSFALSPGESVGLMGPSGCGKSTILRLLAGLLTPQVGTIRVDGKSPAVAARQGDLSIAFQLPGLLPWRTCLSNILLPMELLRRPIPETLTGTLIRCFGLDGAEHKMPHELSGGMAQRASVVRSLVVEPKLLLLDEPLSFVDWPLRRSILRTIRGFCTERRVTAVIVSHDSRELVYLCDRVLVLGAPIASGVREFPIRGAGRADEDLFRSPDFFRQTVALDDFAYAS